MRSQLVTDRSSGFIRNSTVPSATIWHNFTPHFGNHICTTELVVYLFVYMSIGMVGGVFDLRGSLERRPTFAADQNAGRSVLFRVTDREKSNELAAHSQSYRRDYMLLGKWCLRANRHLSCEVSRLRTHLQQRNFHVPGARR
jgi:hypothetical protein